MIQRLRDWLLERKIDATRLALHSARNPQEQRAAWCVMASLIKRRSAQQVYRMERKAGLL